MEKISWRKSTRSVGNPEACIELGTVLDARYIRDSKNQGGPALTFPLARFAAFLSKVRDKPSTLRYASLSPRDHAPADDTSPLEPMLWVEHSVNAHGTDDGVGLNDLAVKR